MLPGGGVEPARKRYAATKGVEQRTVGHRATVRRPVAARQAGCHTGPANAHRAGRAHDLADVRLGF
jgi:hypothetical protein